MKNNYFLNNESKIDWETTGLLEGINSNELKDKIKISFNFARELLLEDFNTKIPELRERVETVIFPVIRRVLSGRMLSCSCNPVINENFEFTKEKMKALIIFISDCSDSYFLTKHLKNIDCEAYLTAFLCDLYISEQNQILKYNIKTN